MAVPGCIGGIVDDGDTAWVLVSSILVLGMMPALAFFEAGLLRRKNVLSVITQVRALRVRRARSGSSLAAAFRDRRVLPADRLSERRYLAVWWCSICCGSCLVSVSSTGLITVASSAMRASSSTRTSVRDASRSRPRSVEAFLTLGASFCAYSRLAVPAPRSDYPGHHVRRFPGAAGTRARSRLAAHADRRLNLPSSRRC